MTITYKALDGSIKTAIVVGRPMAKLLACKTTSRKRKPDALVHADFVIEGDWQNFPMDAEEVCENSQPTDEVQGLSAANEMGLEIPSAVVISR
jgi:hypothetical protein